MRVKTFIAYVVIAGALPLAASWATEPEPQDAALYGSPAVALTSERFSSEGAAALSSDQPMIAAAQSSASASSGNSADTNPPVPAQ
jgi:hypothetical protein